MGGREKSIGEKGGAWAGGAGVGERDLVLEKNIALDYI